MDGEDTRELGRGAGKELTVAQRLEDYDYMWRVLNGSFPVREVMRRRGCDWGVVEAKHRPRIASAKDDLEFCRALADVFDEDFKDQGHDRYFAHVRLFEPARFRQYQRMYQEFAKGAWESFELDSFRPWMEALNQERSERFYSRFDDSASDGKFHWAGEAPTKMKEGDDPVFHDNKEDPNVSCKMLDEDTALIDVKSLNMLRLAGDREKVFRFYKEHCGCKDLILDFRQNGGGATDYWRKILVEPTIAGPLERSHYLTFCVSPENEEYVRCGLNDLKPIGTPDSRVKPISLLPPLPRFERDDLRQLTHFVSANYTIEPNEEQRFPCERVWLLVGPKVYSSSEAFASFAKSSGYATLVGKRTGGDGLGITPFHAVLPNSGLVIRYSGENGLNPDGSSNAEHCTEPDIECEVEDALETCLEKIAR